jgi:hypothetical protein
MDDKKRIRLITEAVRYCQQVKRLGMPSSCYTKALREPIYFLWEVRAGAKLNVPKFRSKAAIGMKFGKGELVYDHAVPFKYLQDELLSLDPVTETDVTRLLSKFDTVVLITKEENAKLTAAGYRSKMPPDWDGIDPLARYKALAIDLVENTRM